MLCFYACIACKDTVHHLLVTHFHAVIPGMFSAQGCLDSHVEGDSRFAVARPAAGNKQLGVLHPAKQGVELIEPGEYAQTLYSLFAFLLVHIHGFGSQGAHIVPGILGLPQFAQLQEQRFGFGCQVERV